MLSNNVLLSKITKLFNLILVSGYYQEACKHGLIHSLRKNGCKKDPSNYRGIALLSLLVQNRIENEIEGNDILSPSQAGFRKNYRTSDHIFTLFSLIKKAISKRKYLYTCFDDFRKAYDSKCRKLLLHRLKEIGLIGKILDIIIIKSMYKSPKVSLIHQDKISQTFLTNIGLKQGDVLSMILFNISQTFLTNIGLKQGDVLSTILFNIYINICPHCQRRTCKNEYQYQSNIVTNGDQS